jgi:hypothetical protein
VVDFRKNCLDCDCCCNVLESDVELLSCRLGRETGFFYVHFGIEKALKESSFDGLIGSMTMLWENITADSRRRRSDRINT